MVFKAKMKTLYSREEGAAMAEYVIMVAVIAMVCAVAVVQIGPSLNTFFEEVPAAFQRK